MQIITDEHLTIYQRYRGDIDGFARFGTAGEKRCMTDLDWACLSELLQRLAIENSSDLQVDPDFIAETTKRIHEASEHKFVAYGIRQLAREEDEWLKRAQTKSWWQFWK